MIDFISKNKGQIGIWTLIIPAGATIFASLGGAFFTASFRTEAKISEVKADVRVIEEREGNHYGEVSKKLDGIDKDIKEILKRLK